ncbi:MAG: type III-A CRISPR-associated RAMP protein Csm3 [Thermoplasmatales archaeon]|nr:type III-A CRISPR-associated RAMP protein Csm3 [Thermoplasmatales archaeon]
MEEINLLGKIIIRGKIKAETGLAIGSGGGKMEIGGVDNPVIKDAFGKPYIPGSSLKGKMRSLLEKASGKKPNVSLGKARIHICENKEEYQKCIVCKIFGLPGEKDFSEPTRLIVRDAFLIEDSITDEMRKNMDFKYTEVKSENVIDRITSAANPRQMERVPAGAEFDFEMIYNVFSEEDKNNLKDVFKGMELLEHDYLGSSGSRGYGKVRFEGIKVYWCSKEDYEKGKIEEKKEINAELQTPNKIVEKFEEIRKNIS